MVRPARGVAEKAVMARYIRPSEWEAFREPIKRFYLETELTLEDIRQRMQSDYLFDASPKQWKDQLSKWQLKRHLNVKEAAHILRLIRQAEAQSVQRTVKFYNREKRLSDISNYIARSKSIGSEAELLQTIKPNDSPPPYITYTDAAPTLFLHVIDSSSDMSAHVSQPSSSTDSLTIPPAQNAPDPALSPLSGAHPSPSWPLVSAEPATNDQNSPAFAPLSTSVDPAFEDVDLLATLEALIPQTVKFGPCEIGYESAIATIRPFERPFPGGSDVEVPGFFHGLMSLTPFVAAAGKHTYQTWDALPDRNRTILGKNAKCNELNSLSDTSCFITHCIYACISRGQGHMAEAEGLIDSAIQNFQNVLKHQPMDRLTVLTNLVTLFESYGQKQMAIEILGRILPIFQHHYGGSDPFSETVRFMMNTHANGCGVNISYDLPKLKDIYTTLDNQYGPRDRLSLTALFNFAWALTEMRQIDEARSILIELKTSCEETFGPYHLLTISCTSLLARVHLYNQEPVTAERLISEIVLARAQKVFSSSHPFFWEIKNRHAIFLRWLSERTQGAEDQRAYIDKAETILREVLLWRFTILGSANPRTQFTFKTLKKLLETQGKGSEAGDLFQWCAAGYQQNLLWSQDAITHPL